MCAGELLLRSSHDGENTPKELLPVLNPARSDSWVHKRKINTNGARCLTDAVHRSVQATFCRVLGTSTPVVL